MRRWLVGSTLLVVCTFALGAPDPERTATDRAHEALAGGDPRGAARQLSGALALVPEGEGRHRLRCLLGHAWLAAGEPGTAEGVLARVPADAGCGRRAAWMRAEALQQSGRLDEAAALVESLGADTAGPDRDGATAEAIAALGRRLLADPDRGRSQGLRLLDLALGLRIGDDRADALADELYVAWEPSDASVPAALCDALLDRLDRVEDPQTRLRAARVCDDRTAELLLLGVPDGPPRDWARAHHRSDPIAVEALRVRALAADGASTDWHRTLADWSGARLSLDARGSLAAVGTADAARQAIGLARDAARWSLVDAEAAAWLTRHPMDPHRAEVDGWWGEALFALARRALADGRAPEALAHYDRLATGHPADPMASTAAYEAGLAERQRGDGAAARRRWEAVRAQFPGSAGAEAATRALARQRAFDDGRLDEATALLRTLATEDPAAGDELARLRDTDLWVSSAGARRGDPTVRIGTRNLERVELRLHRIDPEAYVRGGGALEGLADIDVAAIAPDRTWTVDVPGYRASADLAFETTVDVPGPGLYAVTVAGPAQEARALVLVSDLRAVSRTVNEDTAVAVFDDRGRPIRGARVLLVRDGVVEGRTDGTGRFVYRGGPADPVVLCEQGGAWALIPAAGSGSGAPLDTALRATVELDRPVYLPGDTVGARIVAREGGKPVRGTWTLWLAAGDQALAGFTAEADARGAVHVDLPLPTTAFRTGRPHPERTSFELRGLAPGATGHRVLATVVVAPRDAEGRTLEADLDGDDVVATVRDSANAPVAGVAVRVGDAVIRTDETGRARFAGPRGPLPWRPVAELVGAGLRAVAEREVPTVRSLDLSIDLDRLRPSERASLSVEGSGPAVLTVVRRFEPAAPAPAPEDPWVEEVRPGLRGWRREGGPGLPAPGDWEETVVRRAVALDGRTTVQLDPLPEGDYEVRLATADGRRTASTAFGVDADALRALGMRDVGTGDVLSLTPDGGAALLTAESDRLLWAEVRAAGSTAAVPVDDTWRGPVVLTATGADGGHHVRAVTADPDPVLSLEAVRDGDQVRVVAQVRDRAGRPVDAEVSFTAWDERVQAEEGAPDPLRADALSVRASGSTRWGVGGPLEDGARASAIAPALLAENERRREREKASDAGRSGMLSDNALAEAMMGEVPIGLGSLGAYGSGGGGVGYGSAGGTFGGRGHGGIASIVGARPLPGVRERVSWAVVPTIAGVARTEWTGPAARWVVRATAVTAGGVTVATETVDLRERLFLAVRTPGAGSVDDRAAPTVTVVNGTAEAVSGTLTLGDEALRIELPAHAARSFTAAVPRPAGAWDVPIQLDAGGRVRRAAWRFPLLEGEPGVDGPVTLAAAGPSALAAVVLRGGPAAEWSPSQWADAGRAAVAAWRIRPHPALAARAREVRDVLRVRPDAEDTTPALFLAEARAAGVIPVSDAELGAALDPIVVAGTLHQRLVAARALATAGRPVSPEDLAQLREEATGPEDRAALGHVLRLVGADDAGSFTPLVPAFPPAPGAAALVDWVVAHGGDGVGAATADGRAIPDGEVIALSGRPAFAGPAFTWHGGGVTGGEVGLRVYRVPTGPDGTPVAATPERDAPRCDPCRLKVGEALLDPERRIGAGALDPVGTDGGAGSWVARVPGTFVLAGARTPLGHVRTLRVEVGDAADTPVAAALQLAAATAWREAGVATPLPETDDERLAAPLAHEAFQQALLSGDDAAIALRFRALVATDPTSDVAIPDVVRAARALRATGAPAAALKVWRATADAGFRSEVAGIARMEAEVGSLAAMQRTREAALRYPDGEAVGDALYLLPGRLLDFARDGLPSEVVAAGISATDVRLTAAAWDREFLASYPEHPLAGAAGLRLGRTLLELHAPGAAAAWAHRVAESHRDDALRDALVFLEAVGRTEDGDVARAEPLLSSLAEDLFPDPSGVPRPSVHAEDARMALGRLYEARGRYAAAIDLYAGISAPEAQQAVDILRSQRLTTPPLVRVRPGTPATLTVEAKGIDHLALRAYRVDLRTLFLRDQGLAGVADVAIDGVSPVWTDERTIATGPFPERRELRLPLEGIGAWLVQLDSGETRAAVLVVRSDLELAVDDRGSTRRVDVRRGGRPLAGVEVRGLAQGLVSPAITDVRGVAEVPAGAAVLVWSGDAVAFTDPDAPEVAASATSRPAETHPIEILDRRLDGQRSRDQERWERTVREADTLPLGGL